MARINPFIRSKLFVPGSRPERFAKALASGADAVSFDLEDAVAPDAKAAARAHVAAALAAAGAGPLLPLLIVRVNAPDSAWFDADLRAVVRAGIGWINVPKVESAAAVVDAALRIEALEAERGVASPIGLLVNIETPAALRRGAELGAAHPRVVGLQLGLGDLFEAAGIERRDAANVHAAMFALRLAAAEAGVFAYDGAWPDMADADGLRAEARLAQRLGFAGKSCIHPAQVAPVNAVFSPAAADVAAARRIVDAAAVQRGGVFTLDGRMIDGPFLRRAQAVVAAAAARPDNPESA